MRMTPNHDRLCPTRHQFGNVVTNDRLTEYHAIKNVPNGSVWRLPHLLQIELFDTGFIWRDGCTLDTNTVLQNGFCRINCDLIACCVTMLNTEVVILKVDVEVRKD